MNEAYARFHATTWPPVIERSSYVYVNLIKGQWVPYKNEGMWWEPRHIEYHSLRGSKVEIVQVRVTEVDGRRVVFPVDQALCVRLRFRR